MDLKELLSRYETVRSELEEVKRKPEILREKAEAMRKLLVELEGAIEAANRRKGEALINFAAGEISEAQLADAREHLNIVLRQKAEAQEFLEAAGKASQKIHSVIQTLSQRLVGAQHVFWSALAVQLQDKITSDVIANVHAVYASRSLAGGVGTYENFLRQLFPLPPIDEAQKAQNELAERYGFAG